MRVLFDIEYILHCSFRARRQTLRSFMVKRTRTAKTVSFSLPLLFTLQYSLVRCWAQIICEYRTAQYEAILT